MTTNINENKILYKELSYKIQGLIFDIRNDLGSGHKESIYQKALEKELINAGIKFQKEPPIKIYSRKKEFLGLYRPDFLIENKIIIELKASIHINQQEIKRVYDYLRNSEYEPAYLINFASPRLYIRRLLFTNDRKIWLKLASLFVAISFLFVAIREVPIHAAQLSIFSPQAELSVVQEFGINLLLDTENKNINAVEGKIAFPLELLELKNIYYGDSIISLWIEKPSLKSNAYIVFSGITPGGYSGSNGKILTAVFSPRKKGQSEIQIQSARTLLNDGDGTPARLEIKNLEFKIENFKKTDSLVSPPSLPPSFVRYLPDTIPPEPFIPQIAQDPNIFDNQWFLVFNTQDKGIGLDGYKVQENRKQKTENKNWIEAESPYLLKDQALRSYIFVKATDKSGNERIAMIFPRYPIEAEWYENYLLWIIIILALALTGIIRIATRNKKQETRDKRQKTRDKE